MRSGLGVMVSETSSQSLGWRGKDVVVDLQAFTAQVRKLRVRSFIVAIPMVVKDGIVCGWVGCG
jgi:hypothetical protein